MFDPDTAPFFGPSTIVYPSVTESAPRYGQLDALDFNAVAQLYNLAYLDTLFHTLIHIGQDYAHGDSYSG
ncbi:hypothetical protein J4E85_003644 [Alternaria conjuncta]|uniref:uncharacterized protein n=1 Tax=Alternaria conjuncta TaxID=181017 RepID=UPI00221F3975|nr:uncharacterized protein J4E85_003644 [Alternaria conjuncta]KAI4933239.1 hypothetical protein J4E85_003644 [Alternaria conjuncta]